MLAFPINAHQSAIGSMPMFHAHAVYTSTPSIFKFYQTQFFKVLEVGRGLEGGVRLPCLAPYSSTDAFQLYAHYC